MFNYIKWLFRKRMVHKIEGTQNHPRSLFSSNQLSYIFLIYDGYLGKSWEFIGDSFWLGSPKEIKEFAQVREYIANN